MLRFCFQFLPVIVLLALGGPALAQAEKTPVAAVLEVRPGGGLAREVSPGMFLSISAQPPAVPLEGVTFTPKDDVEGCSAYTVLSGSRPVVAVVRRGTCTFVEKVLNAQRAGAVGVIIVNRDESLPMFLTNATDQEAHEIEIFAAFAPMAFGEKIIAQDIASDNKEPAVVAVSIYELSYLDPAEIALVILATTMVILGAFFSTADMRKNSPLAVPREETLEVDYGEAFGFFVIGSCMLVVLFFLMRYLIYFIIAAFCMGGGSCMVQLLSSLLQYHIPSLKKNVVSIPCIGPVSQANIIASVPASVIVCCFLVFRNNHAIGWIFQDILGCGFLCMFQQTLKLPNIKIATVFLSLMFCFDIFWVFISPVIFHKSVMVEVAKGGGSGETVPMLLIIPAFNDPFSSGRMLGFGDIAIPGLLISYLLRHDKKSEKSGCKGYFVPAVIGYFLGLLVTVAVLVLTEMGQPALLYLVPGTLWTTLVLGCCRGELSDLWAGKVSRNARDDTALPSLDAEEAGGRGEAQE